jgi:hypothetical protein
MHVLSVPPGTVDFSVSRHRPKDADIYINSNFFSRRGPIGELVVAGRRLSSRTKGGGYFFVKGGRAAVSTYTAPRGAEHSSQSILVAISRGKPNLAMAKRAHAREATYRSMIGTDARGALFIVAPDRGCLTTASEMMSRGRSLGLREAILPDAGSSVDYRISDGHDHVSMKSLPGPLKRAMGIEEPKAYILGRIRK